MNNYYEKYKDLDDEAKRLIAHGLMVVLQQTTPMPPGRDLNTLMIQATRNINIIPSDGVYALTGDESLKRLDELYRLIESGEDNE